MYFSNFVKSGQLSHAQGESWDAQVTPWSGKIAVLVSSLDLMAFPAQAMPKQYRDRADAENNFDELKNQWGWRGFTSRKLASSRLMANLVALFYNWWSLYVRFYDEEHHREAIRSRPMFMQGVGRQVQGGGKRTVKVSVLHENEESIARAVTLISRELNHIGSITEKWNPHQRWALILTRLFRRWLGGKWRPGPRTRGQIGSQRVKIAVRSQKNTRTTLRKSSVVNHCAHFPD